MADGIIIGSAYKTAGHFLDPVDPLKATAVVQAANPASGTVKLFEITTELTGVDEHDVPDHLFVVPAGWEKVSVASW